MFRRIIAMLLAGLLLAGLSAALAEPDAVEIEAGFDLPDDEIMPGALDVALSLDAPGDAPVANEAEPEELTLTKSAKRTVALGISYQIVVPGKDIKTCKSSNTKVATVTKQGLLKPRKVGSAKITVTPKKGGKLVLTLKVKDPNAPTAVAIDQGKSATVAAGDTLQLTATVSPDTASQAVTWKSSDKKVAVVNGDGLVTALKKGKATITATAGKLSAKLALTVTKAGWKPCTIAHAMGGIDGYAYSNSMEAFEENYAKGHRLFEVDLHFTSDGKLVLWHSWDYQYCSSHTPGYKPTYKQFMSARIYDRYTPMDLKKLLEPVHRQEPEADGGAGPNDRGALQRGHVQRRQEDTCLPGLHAGAVQDIHRRALGIGLPVSRRILQGQGHPRHRDGCDLVEPGLCGYRGGLRREAGAVHGQQRFGSPGIL